MCVDVNDEIVGKTHSQWSVKHSSMCVDMKDENVSKTHSQSRHGGLASGD